MNAPPSGPHIPDSGSRNFEYLSKEEIGFSFVQILMRFAQKAASVCENRHLMSESTKSVDPDCPRLAGIPLVV